jgi:chromosome segregation ATPase
LISHSLFFVGIFALQFFGFDFGEVLLILTTLVSLEAIYMAIFIQMAVNRTNQSLQEVEEDVAEIQEDVGEIQEDVGEIQEDVGEIQEDFEDVQEDVEVLEGQVSEIQEDLEEITEEETGGNKVPDDKQILMSMEKQLKVLMEEIQALKK